MLLKLAKPSALTLKNIMQKISLFIIKMFAVLPYLYDKVLFWFYRRAMRLCGEGVYMRPSQSDMKGLHNLSVGDGTSIPKGSVFYCTQAPLTIGKKVIFGPRPTIITGDHRIDIIGKYIIDVTDEEKKSLRVKVEGLKINDDGSINGSPYDLPVVIEDDVWVGANVTILKGVTIGRGSVVAAGAVVTRSCPPYSIIGGVPAKVLKMRFTPEEIEEHERRVLT